MPVLNKEQACGISVHNHSVLVSTPVYAKYTESRRALDPYDPELRKTLRKMANLRIHNNPIKEGQGDGTE
uniref:Uncharacterized protein n=1 Tax=Solanum tuberosum TaxID=4113 RepID=M1DAG4_SOLTU